MSNSENSRQIKFVEDLMAELARRAKELQSIHDDYRKQRLDNVAKLRQLIVTTLNTEQVDVGYDGSGRAGNVIQGIDPTQYDHVAERIARDFCAPPMPTPGYWKRQCRWFLDNDVQCLHDVDKDGDYCLNHRIRRVKEWGTLEARFENYEPCRTMWDEGADVIGEWAGDATLHMRSGHFRSGDAAYTTRSGQFVRIAAEDCELVIVQDDRDDNETYLVRRTVQSLPMPAKGLRLLLNDLDEKWWSRRA